MDKLCRRCDQVKPIDQFGINRSKRDGRQIHCIPCRKIVNAESYQKTKYVQNPKRAAANVANKARNQQFVLGYLLEHPCVDCGETDIVVLQFDHQGNKVAHVAKLMAGSLVRLKEEILKCEVVCANCHTRRTAKTFGWWRAAGR
jgi:hypothetical protein